MRVKELYNQVAQLGFEDTLENSDRFYFALSRSVLQVNLLRPRISTVDISHYPLHNGIGESAYSPIVHNGEPIVFTAESPKAYYFEVQGSCVCDIYLLSGDGGQRQLLHIDVPYSRKFTAYRGFIKDADKFPEGTLRISFESEFVFAVRRVALYTEVCSGSEEDIPAYAQYSRYNVRDYAEDFLALASPPVALGDGYSILTDGYETEGSDTLLFPYDKRGCYLIKYKRLPTLLSSAASPAEDERVIDLDEDLCSLLPLLIAVYNLASDEPELANAYRAMYQERAAEIAATERSYGAVHYTDTTNWG